MARNPRTTRRLRIKLDFVVEMDREMTAPPFHYRVPVDAALAATIEALRPHGMTALCTPYEFGIALDHRHLKVTPEERTLMRRMLGLDVAKVAYRNRYCAPADNVPPMLEALASRGLVDRGVVDEKQARFHVSKVGIEIVTRLRERERESAS